MVTNEVPNPGSWNVVSQTQEAGQIGPNQYGTGWRVRYRTGAGIDGDVFIPASEYTVERVRALIQAEVDNLTAINGLSG